MNPCFSPAARPLSLILSALSALLCATAAQAASWTLRVQNAAGQPLADAVIAVEVKGQTGQAPAGTLAQMEQRSRQFSPPILIVQTGTAVNFPNFDTVRHHVYSFSATKKFDLKLYTGTPTAPVLFDKAGVAALGCNIHDDMSAHIIVVDTPHFAKSDAQGLLRLELPAGEHVLKAWHPKLGSPLLSSFTLRLVVGNEPAPVQLPLR
ncbi:methylamine utilization protein [Paucibacter sp. DJ1R-11]|uniref:methylamine utilization protein n=1 Tax=Paucibacter sp. DJ1R-11 TaxID=2893556 RepID=UPI0021E3A24E|nr:methylamine utilization protein [Paucibacter sp. DJ1R-11]MCV2362212.1 methylamine utilization protein [Paucibacter sp. DJ1R-11]